MGRTVGSGGDGVGEGSNGSVDSTDEGGDFYSSMLGHAGILLIKGGTQGPTDAHYFEFGRYPGGDRPTYQGNVQSYPVSGIVLGKNGWPSEKNLHPVAQFITKESGKNTYFHGNVDYTHSPNAYEKAFDYASSFSQEYALVSNSCIIFSYKVVQAGGFNWFAPIPIWNSWPWGQVKNGFFQNHITYNPKNDYFNENVWQIPGW